MMKGEIDPLELTWGSSFTRATSTNLTTSPTHYQLLHFPPIFHLLSDSSSTNPKTVLYLSLTRFTSKPTTEIFYTSPSSLIISFFFSPSLGYEWAQQRHDNMSSSSMAAVVTATSSCSSMSYVFLSLTLSRMLTTRTSPQTTILTPSSSCSSPLGIDTQSATRAEQPLQIVRPDRPMACETGFSDPCHPKTKGETATLPLL